MALLSASMRHTVKNLLTAQSTYILLSKKENECTEEQREHYLDEALSIAKKINEQIEFQKKYELDGSEDSWQQLADIYNFCKPFPLSIEITAEEGVGLVKIYASPLVQIVFENLKDNTIRHGGNVTKIKISKHININNELVLICEDNGKGIDHKDKKRIFDKGFGKNTGMGLYLAREILDLTDIKICETGEPGKGARFEIIVPKDRYLLS